jgi:hypothetical protein
MEKIFLGDSGIIQLVLIGFPGFLRKIPNDIELIEGAIR